jgi:RHS repeat-associated protein
MTMMARTVRAVAGFALVALFLGMGSAQAQSAGTTIFGPFTVTLPSTSTFSFSRSFNVPQPVQGSYLVRLELGTPNSLKTLSLRLNNTQVFALSNFAGGVTRVDKVLTLLASNTLALSVAGATGTRIAITVFTVVMSKPVSLSPNPLLLNIGAGGTLTATLSPAPTAAGTLNVTGSSPSVATVPSSVPFASGQTSVAIPVSALAPGNATVTASTNSGQASAVVSVNAPASVSLTAPAANSVFQAPATITITAAAADPDGTVARVDFFQGATSIGTAFSAPYTFIWTNVAAGSYSLTAVATDNQGASTTSSAVTVRVNAPPSVSLTTPANGATFTTPATIPLSATAADSDGSIVRVDFFQGATFIGTVSAAAYTFNWTNVGQGSYAITARATDNDGATTVSAAVTITVNSGVAQMYYIVPDHLNTPRMIADSTGTTVWRWDQGEPFGNDVPNNNPAGLGAFDFNLRFPGQYFDRETGLAYNVDRDYDSRVGRYVQSDPIGLIGGLNPYSYVRGNPIGLTDPTGESWEGVVVIVVVGTWAINWTYWNVINPEPAPGTPPSPPLPPTGDNGLQCGPAYGAPPPSELKIPGPWPNPRLSRPIQSPVGPPPQRLVPVLR